ncbi:MAG: nuclear transport factor 2 family protein [Bacteroidota bacterium]
MNIFKNKVVGIIIHLLLMAVGVLHEASAQEITTPHKDSITAIVMKYYELNLKIFQVGSGEKDVDKLFELFTHDFIYEHPRYGGTYSRSELYDGYRKGQENGRYNGTTVDIKVENKIVGLKAVVVEKRFVKKTGNGLQNGKLEMTLFEFRNGKIARITEFW